jgi:hypothetical protein
MSGDLGSMGPLVDDVGAAFVDDVGATSGDRRDSFDGRDSRDGRGKGLK